MFGLGLMEGMLLEEAIIEGAMINNMARQNRGCQEIIINQNGQTTIIEQYGRGPMMGREQIIINQNGQTTIIEEGYGGFNQVICLPGCTRPCCRRVINCPPNCTNFCCRPRVICQPGCMNSCCRQNVIVCQTGCTGPCCRPLRVNIGSLPLPRNFEQAYSQRLQVEFERQKAMEKDQNFKKQQINFRQMVVYGSSGNALILYDLMNYQSRRINNFILTPTHLGGNIINADITKLKAKSQRILNGYRVLKIVSDGVYHLRAVPCNEHREWFALTAYAKMAYMGFSGDMYAYAESLSGQIFKKSEFLGNWEPRYVTIVSGILKSHKSIGSQTSLTIEQASEIWTRFQTIQNGSFIIIKVFHTGGIVKSEFAVPCRDAMVWFRALHSLLHVF